MVLSAVDSLRLTAGADAPDKVHAHTMARQYQHEISEIRQRLLASGAPLSAEGLAGLDTELVRFAFTTGLTHAQTPAERCA